MKNYLSFLILFFFTPIAFAETHQVFQQNNLYSTNQLNINSGDDIYFKNNDSHYHSVYSLTDNEHLLFLGAYGEGENRGTTFSHIGTIEVRCSYHDDEKILITSR